MLGDDTSILDGAYMYTAVASFLADHAPDLCSTIDLRKHTTELSYSQAEFLYLVVFRGLPVDMASYIYQSVRAEALKTDVVISLLHGILLTHFLHSLLVPEGADEPRAIPVGSINKTTLSKSIAQTRQALNAARAARVRQQEQPEKMQSVLRPTHEMVSDISCRLITLEQKVMDMDSGWKKEIAVVQEAMRKTETSANLFALTQQVVHIEEHLSQIRDVLTITNDDNDDL
ncbi:hypothetical protein CJ030_MR5G009677 [Morella rubra]|uniref:Uncharacterized protein n=1 Tax=Morella rubra TaxID=262757 RepID=A0A6A1VJ61_9ROSI|nr:hypothetical protein CJ030_MR5G009677 [Morella rubra]